ncbi:MAG: hypothetical protein GY862_13035 [Gammaproteobacteria bacterium]|nr:hypothetical protein [Gammaproteobacteria bacterium]
MMRDYGKVEVSFWSWARRNKLSDKAKLLAVYLLSNRFSNSVGCYELFEDDISTDQKWPDEIVTETLSELFDKPFGEPFAYYCRETEYVFVRDHLNHNPPANGNVAKAMAKAIEAIPRRFTYWPELIDKLKPLENRFPKGFINSLEERFMKGFRNQKQEQEQKQEQKDTPSSSLRSDGPPRGSALGNPEHQAAQKEKIFECREMVDAVTLADPPKKACDPKLEIPTDLQRDENNKSPLILVAEEKEKEKYKHRIPDDWKLTPNLRGYAEEKAQEYGVEVNWDDVVEGFVIHHKKMGKKFVDWDAAWKVWVRNHFKYAMQRGDLPNYPGGGGQLSLAEQAQQLEEKKKAAGL